MNIIFFGNQKLVQGIKADVATITNALVAAGHNIIATISTKEDLAKVPIIVAANPNAIAVLASFGYIVPASIIELFEPIGILNIHPSLLPKYRGPTPIETPILNGDTKTGISIMKLATAMDAGPIYAQKTLPISQEDNKFTLCEKLTSLGAQTLVELLKKDIVNSTTPQNHTEATYTQKLTKSMSNLQPSLKTALQLDREVRAFLNFPKSKLTLLNIPCTITATHTSPTPNTSLDQKCIDGNYLIIDELIPENSKKMTAQAFLNGHKKS